tara:strand:+ start:718 stop:1470 length:753 start_codon:yes stop_codon:yes gene_type:complete
MSSRVAYICAIFFGPRRSWLEHWGNVDPLYCLKEQIRCLLAHATRIERVVFVCNLRDDDLDEETYAQAQEIVAHQDGTDSTREWVICSRPNVAFSYGAWEHGLCGYVDELDYAFLMEDDYVPCKDGFDDELITRYFSSEHSQKNVLYCSSWWKYNRSANSNGIINISLFRHRNTFSLPRYRSHRPHYKHGDDCQRVFLRQFTSKGYEIINMAKDYSFPFFCMSSLQDDYKGVKDGEVLLRPVSYEGAVIE